MKKLPSILFVFSLLFVVRPAAAQRVIGSASQYIVYGEDDRRDVVDVSNKAIRQLANHSTVSLIQSLRFFKEDGGYLPFAGTLVEEFGICEDEAFSDQPAAADCSGVLVDRDIVLTAGHCFEDDDTCSRYAYVFGYQVGKNGELATLSEDDIYGCRRILRRELTLRADTLEQDFTLVQLDRPVTGARRPVEVRTEALDRGAPLTVVGAPVGLPTKIDRGGIVKEARAAQLDYFTATTDTFQGNSGSGMFDEEGLLAGHLVLGGEDFGYDREEDCARVVVVPDGVVPELYEHGVYVNVWRDSFCAEGWPSAHLCGRPGSCGDGVCSDGEAAKTCPSDCDEPLCSGLDCETEVVCDDCIPPGGGEFSAAELDDGCSIGRSQATAGPRGLTLLLLMGALVLRRRSRA